MRQFIISIVALALLPQGARAQRLQDRYDPPNEATATAAALRGGQTLLSWTGKVEPMRGPQSESDGLRGPELLDTSTGQAVNAAYGPRGSGRPLQAQPRGIASAPPPTRLPTSLYDNGYAEPAPPARPSRPVQGQLLPPAAPTRTAQSAQPAQGAAAQPADQEQTPRYYSLHREYGLQPDPTPQAQPSVLALSPTVATAMADNTDNSPTIDLAGQDQAAVDAPPRLRNNASGSGSSTSTSGSGTSTYKFNNQ
jgi:hypothetical protein